jgi:rRNA-processing protein FCF1
MKKVLLDTNFILTCVRQKIDLFEEIYLMGMQILIPEQVINEIERIKNLNSQPALKLLEKNKFKKIDIGRGHVDKKIIQFAKENPDLTIATLDREIKNKTKNPKLIIRGKKKLEII